MAKLLSRSLLLVVVASAMPGCGAWRELKEQKKHDSDDKVNTYSTQAPFARPTDCRAQIAKAMCLVDIQGDDTKFPDNSKPRPCLDGGQRYTAAFEQLYDSFPASLQKMFCSLQRINVEKTFDATAYADTIWVKNDATGEWHTNGGVLGIRQTLLDAQLDLSKWASWKEELSFGGVKESYSLTENLPVVETQSPNGANDILYFIIAHEFGHFFDAASGANDVASCAGEGKDRVCKFKDRTWGAISWQDTKTVKAVSDFTDRNKFCFYRCEGHYIPADAAPVLYAALEKSPFLSAYASTNPYEEFADSFAYTTMNENLHSSFRFLPPGGPKYDVMAKLGSPAFAAKAQFIKSLQNDLYYP